MRVPKPATDKKQENVQAYTHKDEKHLALYVEPLHPKTKEIDPYEQVSVRTYRRWLWFLIQTFRKLTVY